MASATNPSSAVDTKVRSGFLPDRIIHLHPTRLCNLACLHCYSESDPGQRSALDPLAIGGALEILRAEGYALVSLSGGEPLVYKPLRQVIDRAHELGFRVTMITNGLLVTERTESLLAELDGVAVSFDGLAETHNAVRGRPDAFARASAAVERLAASGRPVAAAISLARDAIPELPDLVDHLVSLGARAIQVRPVARAGRARGLADSTFYSDLDRARLYLVILALQRELSEHVRVHSDLAPAQGLWNQRDAYAGLLATCDVRQYEDRPLADVVNPLVITDTGILKPIAFDFDRRFDVASMPDLSPDRLSEYKREGLPKLQDLVGGAVASLKDRTDLLDWFDYCTRLSDSGTTESHAVQKT